jgi:hypothetical protein
MNTIPEMTNEERDAFNYPFHHTPSSVAQAGVVLVGYILRVEQYLEERRMSAASNVNPEFPLYPSLSEEGASSKLTAVRIAELEAQLAAINNSTEERDGKRI